MLSRGQVIAASLCATATALVEYSGSGGRRVYTPMSRCERSAALETAYSATYPANDPSEDRSIASTLQLGAAGKQVKMIGVFDGHGGWQVSEFVSENIVEVVTRHLNSLTEHDKSATNTAAVYADESAIGRALRSSFAELEGRYVKGVRQSFAYGFGQVARVGCCALVALRVDDKLSIANAGDCRAVMGCSSEDDSDEGLVGIRITRDHNAREPLEVLRLKAEHPGESESSLVRCKNPHACYVKGRLQLTRALGDAYLKYEEFNAPPGQHRDRGRHIKPPNTPPYVGAVPQLHHLQLQPKRDRFLVIASDGVWDYLSDQDAVDVVARARAAGECPAEAIRTAALTVAAEESGVDLKGLLQFPPGRQRRGRHDDTTAVVLFL
jgi:pyruvate dehydrogenase phosphatase